MNPANLKVRESRDSAEHPNSNAIIVGLDVTGSMSRVVVSVRDALGKLMNMLLKEKYISDPQILFCAVGDATSDVFPVQISQFESDNRIDDQIKEVVLEGSGGAFGEESYELEFYVAAEHTSIDCWEKRKKKGYLFTIGDEEPYPEVKKYEVDKIFNVALQKNVSTDATVKEAQKKYFTFHIIPYGSSGYGKQEIKNRWVKLLGGSQFVFELKNPSLISETIALAIGLNEERVSFKEGLEVISKNSGQKSAEVIRLALSKFAESVGVSKKKPVSEIVTDTEKKKTEKKDKPGRI